ncbi:MAG: fimbrial protein FimV, partial [Chromatiaceae bacterium]
MVRKLALAVSLALGTVSVPVYALGLGELSSKSTLNQNFEGNIPLLSVLPEELDGVRVNLADAEIFERAGVERPFYLSLLRFEPALTDSGKTVVRVTSEFPIREPFLNFLVEVNWPKGRLVREYTVLLDPPTTTMRRAPKVSPAATPARTAVVPSQPSAAVAASSGGTTQRVSAAGSEYGPVRANDTAWRIAEEVRPSGVSIEQTMMALLEANP